MRCSDLSLLDQPPHADEVSRERKRSFSGSPLEEWEDIAAGTPSAAPVAKRDHASVRGDGEDAPAKFRTERKLVREKKRRMEVNERFQELISTISPIEDSLGLKEAKPSNSCRAQVLSRTMKVVRKLWLEHQMHQRLSPDVAAAAPGHASTMTRLAPKDGEPSEAQAKQAMPALPGLIPGMGNMPMMMFMPMFMPAASQLSTSNLRSIPLAPHPAPQQTAVQQPEARVGEVQDKAVPVTPLPGTVAFKALQDMHRARTSIPLPHFVTQALDPEAEEEAPTHAVCA
jgi:hypothetical protein